MAHFSSGPDFSSKHTSHLQKISEGQQLQQRRRRFRRQAVLVVAWPLVPLIAMFFYFFGTSQNNSDQTPSSNEPSATSASRTPSTGSSQKPIPLPASRLASYLVVGGVGVGTGITVFATYFLYKRGQGTSGREIARVSTRPNGESFFRGWLSVHDWAALTPVSVGSLGEDAEQLALDRENVQSQLIGQYRPRKRI